MSFVDDFFSVRNLASTLIVAPYNRKGENANRFDEFVSLVEACDLQPVGVDTAAVREIHPGTLFREGQIERFHQQVVEQEIDLIAVDADLSPVQQRQLEKKLGAGVLDRTAIILMIFGRRATTSAGKLQVQLAQSEYVLPRLVGLWQHFDREKGGIGMRGAGEKQIEMDRRVIGSRIAKLKRELKTVHRTHDLHRSGRRRSGIFHVAIVGYTNAGKSTLLSQLTDGDVFAADMPFATLDTLTRQVRFSDGTTCIVTDTVGFVRDLPHGLVEAFKGTLEEAVNADALVHVIDASAEEPAEQVRVTEEVLAELGVREVPMLYVLNKMNAVRSASGLDTLQRFEPKVFASLNTGEGLDAIRDWIRHTARRFRRTRRVQIPIDRPELIAIAEETATTPGTWHEKLVEYDVPETSELVEKWSVD